MSDGGKVVFKTMLIVQLGTAKQLKLHTVHVVVGFYLFIYFLFKNKIMAYFCSQFMNSSGGRCH